MIDSAISLAKKGFYVFPIVPNTKIPPKGFHFKEEATRDIGKIKHWWSNGYSNHNIGIFTEKFGESEALLVVDIDQKDGKMGKDELIKLELEGLDFPTTCQQRTPSGGTHLIYRTKKPVRNSVEKLGRGIDIRSQGGYIVGPGSVLENGQYVLRDGEVCEAPEGLVSRLYRPSPKPNDGPPQGAFRVNEENALSRARHYLQNEAPISIQGSRNDTTFKVAARIKDFGVSSNDSFTLMSEVWAPRCESVLDTDEFYAAVKNAYRYGETPQGADSPDAAFTVIETNPNETTIKPKKKSLFVEDFLNVEPNFNQTFLVEKMLSPGAMSVVYGESNTGKTFLCLDLALHISVGQPWMDKRVEKGLVVYIAAEGGQGIKKRIKAFKEYHKLQDSKVPFCLIPCPINLLNNKDHVKEVIEIVKDAETRYGEKANLIVIDTLARAMAGGNENSSEDMGAFVSNVDTIRSHTKSHVMVIHHSGKDVAKGARGHSSLKAATDTEIEVADNVVRVTKQRDMDFCKSFGFKLEQVEIGVSDIGEKITSCIVQPSNTLAQKDFSHEPLNPNSLTGKGWAALNSCLEWSPIPAPNELELADDKTVVSINDWREEFYKSAYPGQERKHSHAEAFTRAVKALYESGRIAKTDQYAWI